MTVETPLLSTTAQMGNLADALLDRYSYKYDLVTVSGPANGNPSPGMLSLKRDMLTGEYKAKITSVRLSLKVDGKEATATHTYTLLRKRS